MTDKIDTFIIYKTLLMQPLQFINLYDIGFYAFDSTYTSFKISLPRSFQKRNRS